jgi:hypothetical protein
MQISAGEPGAEQKKVIEYEGHDHDLMVARPGARHIRVSRHTSLPQTTHLAANEFDLWTHDARMDQCSGMPSEQGGRF